MLNYVKLFVIALFGGLFASLPVSGGAHIAFLNSVTSFSSDQGEIGFYYAIIAASFALVAIFKLRRIYAKVLRNAFAGKRSGAEETTKKNCRSVFISVLISLIPAALMMIPLQDGFWTMDIYTMLLQKEYLLMVGSCCIGSGIFLFLAMWYTKQKYDKTRRFAKPVSVLRFALYQLPSFFFPGVSGVATGSTALLLTDVDETVIVREVLQYLAPSVLIVNIARIVRYVMADHILQPLMITVAVVGAVAGAFLMINLISKFNIRKKYLFFAVYSILFGLFVDVTAFAF